MVKYGLGIGCRKLPAEKGVQMGVHHPWKASRSLISVWGWHLTGVLYLASLGWCLGVSWELLCFSFVRVLLHFMMDLSKSRLRIKLCAWVMFWTQASPVGTTVHKWRCFLVRSLYFFISCTWRKYIMLQNDASYISIYRIECLLYIVHYPFKKSLLLRPYLKFCIYVYKCNLLYYIFAYYILL